MSKLAWGIIGTGRIAGVFANGLKASSTGELIAVGSRSQESADKFGDEFNVPRCHGTYEALLARARLDHHRPPRHVGSPTLSAHCTVYVMRGPGHFRPSEFHAAKNRLSLRLM